MRWIRWILGAAAALLVLILVGLAILLIPAHLQVRAVEPALPSEADLRALLAVPDGPIRIRYVETSSQQLPDNVLGHNVILAEWANGSMFMIDAGMDRAAALEFGRLMQRLLEAGEPIPNGSIAELMGDDVARVRGVGFTHLHIDHTQGVLPFCEVRGSGATVFQTPWQAHEHNFSTTEGAQILADSCLASQIVAGEGVATVDRFPGLALVALGGHTPGSTLFAIASQGRLWLFSGDITNSRRELIDDLPKSVVYTTFIVPENTARSTALRAWLRGLDAQRDIDVIVSHDLDALRASGLEEYRRP
jgi:glyoxylase-like metal-dependent hydrolase (beta-lactamase superfamily II)